MTTSRQLAECAVSPASSERISGSLFRLSLLTAADSSPRFCMQASPENSVKASALHRALIDNRTDKPGCSHRLHSRLPRPGAVLPPLGAADLKVLRRFSGTWKNTIAKTAFTLYRGVAGSRCAAAGRRPLSGAGRQHLLLCIDDVDYLISRYDLPAANAPDEDRMGCALRNWFATTTTSGWPRSFSPSVSFGLLQNWEQMRLPLPLLHLPQPLPALPDAVPFSKVCRKRNLPATSRSTGRFPR